MKRYYQFSRRLACVGQFQRSPKARCLTHSIPLLLLMLAFCQFAASGAFGQACPPAAGSPPYIGGNVFLDYGQDGVKNANIDQPVQGVLVKAFNVAGALVASGSSQADGTYLLVNAGFVAGTYRLEFSNLPTGNFNSAQGTGNGTSVQFAAASTCNNNFAVAQPNIYCQSNPSVVLSCFVEGANTGAGDVLISVPYNVTPAAAEANDKNLIKHEAIASAIGTTYGLAYQRHSGTLFAAAFMKRFTGFGPSGPAAIYKVPNPDDGVNSGSLFLNLSTLLGANAAGADPHNFTTKTAAGDVIDGNSYNAATRVAFGDMDISDDDLNLWVINLNDRSLYRIPLGTDPKNPVAPTLASQIEVIPLASTTSPLPGLPTVSNNSEIRPFALKFYKGKVYVGLVTNGEAGGGLRGLVYSYNPATSTFTKELDFTLDYNRGCGFGNGNTCYGPAKWNKWVNTNVRPTPAVTGEGEDGYPQPILADIDFDANGNMILGMRDRFGDQDGYSVPPPNASTSGSVTLVRGDAFGDLLKAPKTSSGWSLNIADFTDASTALATKEAIFGGDNYSSSPYYHEETSMGGLAILLRDNGLVTTVMDPRTTAFSNGLDWFDLSGTMATTDKSLTVLAGATANAFGKANGLGETEFICDLAPIEIGNRVWNDLNKNGIQDPDEPVLVGVTVQLYTGAGVAVTGASVVTDAQGRYIFSSGEGTNTVNAKYNLAIAPLTDYQVKITALGTNASVTGVALTSVTPLTPGETGATNSGATLSNNDAKLVGGLPTIVLTTGIEGDNNHTYDFALFCEPPVVTATLYTAATCATNGSVTPNNNASLKVTTDGSKAAISTTGTPTTTFAAATAVASGSVTFSSLNGQADSLYVRVFKSQDCFTDTIIVVTPVVCCPTVTVSTPANFTTYCAGASIPTLTATTTAQSPDSIRFVYFDNKQTVAAQIYAGTNVLGKVKITGTAATNNTATLTNVPLPTNNTAVNDTIWIYAVYLANNGSTVCQVFGEKPVILKPQPNAGPDATVCAPATTAQLTAVTAGGTFAAQAGNPANATITNAGVVSNLTANGIYRFIYTVSGCTDTATVTRSPKPNAGADQTLACADATAGTLQTSTTLTGFTPAGGVFTAQAGNPAAATVTNTGVVSGMTVAGTYNFIYTLNDCADTVSVTVQPCPTCTKPNAGADQSICAPATTATLTGFSPAGGVFTVQADNPAAATVTSAGAVSGLTANGTYRFIYSVTLGGQTCTDTVQVIRNPKPVVNDAAICAPAATVTLTFSPAGGTFAPLSGNPATASITAAGVVSGMTVNGTYNFIYTLNGCADTASVTRNAKPNAGVDSVGAAAICNTVATIDLPDAMAGEQWSQLGSTPKAVTIDPTTGVVTGLNVVGTYQFLLSNATTTCSDTVSVEVKDCANGTIGDLVWKDLNDDGKLDLGEPGVPGVVVQLLNGTNNAVITSDTTDVNGTYTFTGLAKGDYKVKIDLTTLPDSCLISTKLNSVAAGDSLDSDFDSTGVSPVVSLDPILGGINKDNPTIDAALYSPKGSIGDFVWKDLNDNGQQDPGEPGVNNVKVTLHKAIGGLPGPAIDSTLTAGTGINAGAYNFTNLPKGDYIVKIDLTTLPDSCQISTKPNAAGVSDSLNSDFNAAGLSPVVPIDPTVPGLTKNNPTIDAALYSPKGSIGDFVWKDLNDNGQQDPGEPGVNNVKVTLHKAIGGLPGPAIDSTVTAGTAPNAGAYSFTNLLKGDYLVKIDLTTLPDSCQISTKPNAAGVADSLNSDFNGAGLSQVVAIDPAVPGLSKDNPTIDAALYTPKGSIGDFVWKDLNDDGQQDPGEPGVNGVKVTLHMATGGLPGPAIDSTTTSGTGANAGAYSFTNLSKGDYIVKIDLTTLPDSCLISTKPNAVGVLDSLDSDFDSTGLSPVVTIDPAQPGLNKNNPTVDAALYTPKGSIGDFVWKDLNDDGQQDPGEPGVNGVKLTLHRATNGLPGPAIDSTLTSGAGANAGAYSFTNLPKGDYIVKIDKTTIPDTCALSRKPNAAGVADSLDSDFDSTGLSQVVSIDPAQPGLSKNNPTIDAALRTVPTGTITDPCSCFKVEYALDENKKLSETIEVKSGTGETWKVIAQTGAFVMDSTAKVPLPLGMTLVEGPAGIYKLSFTHDDDIGYTIKVGNGMDTLTMRNLCAGSYPDITLTVLDSTICQNADPIPLTAISVPAAESYQYFYKDKVTGERVNITELDPSQFAAGDTVFVKLEIGPTNPQSCPTIIVQPVVIKTEGCEQPVGSIGDFIFKDLNDNGKQDAGEPGVNNVKVTLHNSTGGLPGPAIDSTTTAGVGVNAGKYSFTNLAKGDYIVKLDKTSLPDSCLISTKPNAAGVADSLDSDFDPTTGLSQVISIDPAGLGLTKNNPTIDAALYTPKITVDLALDKSIDKKLAMLGDTVTYTIRVFNQGTTTATGVEVTDSLATGLQFISSNGTYSLTNKIWMVGTVAASDTVSLVIKAKVVGTGVVFNTAQIRKVDQQDVDSTPGNNAENEDDIDRECFTVPILLCKGDGKSVGLNVPAQYQNVVWFRKVPGGDPQGGQPVQVATGNSYEASETELGSYEYTYTSTSGTCPAGGCCPIVIVVEDCCVAEICVPVTVKKVKIK